MAKDARLLLNLKKQRKQGNNNRNNNNKFNDARQVITARKNVQSLKNRINRGNVGGQLRMNQVKFGLITKKNQTLNQRLTNTPKQTNLNRRRFNVAQNKSPGFIAKSFLNQQNKNMRQAQNNQRNFPKNWRPISSPNSRQPQTSNFQNRNSNAAVGAKRFLARQANITVTRPIWREQSQQQVDERDELERMTIDDITESSEPAFKFNKPVIASPQKYARSNQYLSTPRVADNSLADASSSDQGCKVLVSNLRHTVTEIDISELFGDIGMMRSASLVGQGRAEIEYYAEDSANKACSVYHNVLLDGQPMSCVIQKSIADYRKPIASRLGEKMATQMPMQYQQPLASRSPQTMYHNITKDNRREVSFIVKLP